MKWLSNKCCNWIGLLPKFQPSLQKVVQIPQNLPCGRLLKAISPEGLAYKKIELSVNLAKKFNLEIQLSSQ